MEETLSRKTLILLMLALASFVAGVAGQYFWPDAQVSAAELGFVLVGAFLIFAWYHADARQRGYRRPKWLDVGVILLAIVAMPYYFFRTRGFARGLLAITLGVLVVIGTSIATGVGKLATYFLLQA